MAFILADRVKESCSSPGTGTVTLLAAATGYQSFSAGIGANNTTYYVIADQGGANWEVGLGTIGAGGTTLARTTVLSSSNSGSLVNFASGTQDVFCDYPAGKAIIKDANGNTSWNNEAPGYTNYVTSGQTISLTASSTYYQHFSGSSTATLKLPDETTIPVGLSYIIDNDSSANITVQDSGGNLLTTVTSGMAGYIYSLSNSAATGNWAGYIFPPGNNVTGTPITWGTSGLNMAGTGIDNAVIGATTPNTGTFTTLGSTGTASLGTASTTYIRAIGDASYPGIYATGGTNTPLVLQPLGTGALQAQKTDSTTTGGNARGANSVDWQTSRSAASQVASGSQSFLGGGFGNTVASGNSAIVSGASNNVTAAGSNGFIGSGASNQVTQTYSNVVGGQSNTASGYYGNILGGYSNSTTSSSTVTTQATTAVTSGSTAVTLSGSNASIKVGQLITGTGIVFSPPTYVAAISGTSLTLSQNANATGTPTLSFYTPHGVVVGGGNNQATGSYSFIGGGGDAGTAANRNVASGDWSFVGGGQQNTASGLQSVVVGSQNNQATAQRSAVVGGFNNQATGLSSFIGGGEVNVSSGVRSLVSGGSNNQANADYSTVLGGNYATARGIVGSVAFGVGFPPISSTVGVSQGRFFILGRQTTDATATVLATDGNAAGTTNQVILPNNSAYYFKGEVISGVTGGGNTKGWEISGVIKRGANAASTTLVGSTVTSLYADAGASTWSIALTADTTNGGLAVTFTGQASTTIRTVCQIRTTEMTY